MRPKEITDNAKFIAVDKRRNGFATEARAAQKAFRRYTSFFISMTALAAITSGLVLYGIEAPENPSQALLKFVGDDNNRRILTWIMALSLAMVAFCEYMNRTMNFGKRHVENRVKAEMLRWERERVALQIGHRTSPEVFEAVGNGFLQFIDQQIKHAEDAKQRYSKSAWLLAIVGASLVAIAAFAGAMGGFDETSSVVAYIALAGVCIPALTAAVKAWGEAEGGGQRSDLHATTWDQLNVVRGDSARFKQAINANDLAAAEAYQEEVFNILKEDLDGFVQIKAEDA